MEMMKVASKTKNYTEVDDFIVNRLGHYMYNNGEGRLVPIDYVVMNRNRERPKTKLVGAVYMYNYSRLCQNSYFEYV